MKAITIAAILAVATACGTTDGRVQDYIDARAAHQHGIDSACASTSWQAALRIDSAWLVKYAPRLRQIVGPLGMRGLTDTGSINTGWFRVYDCTPAPDGLLYQTRDSATVFVTDTTVFRAYLAQVYGQQKTPLPALEGIALNALITEASLFRYVDLPLNSATKRVLGAALGNYAQDFCLDCAPRHVIVAATAGRRLFVAHQEVPDSIPVPETCKQAARDYWKSSQDDEGFARLLRCYADSVRADRRFNTFVGRAQALLDRLPDR